MLSDEDRSDILRLAAHYDFKRGAVIEALKLVQERHGWVSDEAVQEVAGVLDMSSEEVDNVATFYNLIFRQPVARHVIYVCDSISCWIMGSSEIAVRFRERMGIGFGETTPDGRFTLLPISCLGTCDHAPAIMIDRDTYTNLDAGKLDEILAQYP